MKAENIHEAAFLLQERSGIKDALDIKAFSTGCMSYANKSIEVPANIIKDYFEQRLKEIEKQLTEYGLEF